MNNLPTRVTVAVGDGSLAETARATVALLKAGDVLYAVWAEENDTVRHSAMASCYVAAKDEGVKVRVATSNAPKDSFVVSLR